MPRNTRQLFFLRPLSLFLTLGAPLSVSAAHAGTVPSITLGDVVIKPYATDQLDIGGFPQTSVPAPGVGIRAARLRNGARITIHKQFEIGAIWDFGPVPHGPMRLFEGQFSYLGLKHFVFTAGIFKPSFGLESMQAQGDTVFIERASIATITRNLAAGIARQAVQIEAHGTRYHVAVAGTAGTAGPDHDGNQRAIVFRLVGIPIRTRDILFHVGFSGEWVFKAAQSPGQPPAANFSDFPELNVGLTGKFLDTGRIPLRSAGAFGLEAAAAWKRLLVQGEAYEIEANRRENIGSQHLHFSGWYAQASYTLIGKPRAWKSRTAAFSAPTCQKNQTTLCDGSGVLEAGVRFSDANLRSASVDGGHQQTWSANLNWWPTDILRVSLQYENGTIRETHSTENFQAVLSMLQIKF
ncbi:OprO/OprP family phosphate-selective porin [Acetobacter senegalensis]|uniref:OprO/OprP family phosphate-selective porin n=1 Tax=Acetobacter senegalensis TaxID=446692 RepID=UPI000ADF0E04|nr:porin [Acetobacter senegalensis]